MIFFILKTKVLPITMKPYESCQMFLSTSHLNMRFESSSRKKKEERLRKKSAYYKMGCGRLGKSIAKQRNYKEIFC